MPQAVIMAGGPGDRFWPLTTAAFPKYCMRIDGKKSLLQKTYARLLKIYKPSEIWVVTTRAQAPIIRRELPRLGAKNILVEPFRRNTAAALLFAASFLCKKFGFQEVISFFPADHLIEQKSRFAGTVRKAIRLARQKDALVTIGIRPTFAATGYGYIEGRGSRVKRFVEKPSSARARVYLRSKRFFWNSGIFSWRAGIFLESMRKYNKRIYQAFDAGRLAASYRRLPAVSIDTALLEKARNIALVPARMDWCDMGNWDMFLSKAGKDRVNLTGRPLVIYGVPDLLVVQTGNGTLVCRRGESEEAARFAKKECL